MALHKTEEAYFGTTGLDINVLDAGVAKQCWQRCFPGTKEVVTIYYSKVNPDKLKDVDSLCRYTKEEKPPCMIGWNKSTDLIHWM